ncbi:MAG: translocation/assembly module TamB [Bacteroidaceae bacterium]|nr:translocation/assembly module TamB [Bacteroidaceae bacterium]
MSVEFQTTVAISRVRVGLINRLVLDDVLLLDQQNDTLLSAVRMSAKMDVGELFRGRIRVDNVQLFGYNVKLRRDAPSGPYNFQFLIDKFSSQDTTSSPIDLAINNIIVRRGSLSHDLTYEPPSDRFSIAHFRLNDLHIRASIDSLTNNYIKANISELGFTEPNSKLTIKNLNAAIAAAPEKIALSEALITLPETELRLDAFVQTTESGQWTSLSEISGNVNVDGIVTPNDLTAVVPQSHIIDQPVALSAAASIQDGYVNIRQLQLSADGFNFLTSAKGHLNSADATLSLPLDQAEVNIQQFTASSDFYGPILNKLTTSSYGSIVKPELANILSRLGNICITGKLEGSNTPHLSSADLCIQTSIGSAAAVCKLSSGDLFTLHAETSDVRLAELLASDRLFPVDNVTLTADADGSINQRAVIAHVKTNGLKLKDDVIDNIDADINLSPRALISTAMIADDQYSCKLDANIISASDIDFSLKGLDALQGFVTLSDVNINTQNHKYNLNNLHVALTNDEHGHHMLARGDFIDAYADGHFSFDRLVPTVRGLLHQVLPSLIKAPQIPITANADQLAFSVNLWDSRLLQEFTNLNIHLTEPGYVEGSFDGAKRAMTFRADMPHVEYGSEDFRAVSFLARQQNDSLTSFVTLQRMMESGPVDLSLSAEGKHDNLHSTIAWDDHNQPAMRGSLTTTTHFSKDPAGKLGFHLRFHPTTVVLSDTIWNVHTSDIHFADGVADVSNFKVSQLGRHLLVNGRVSKENTDTLYTDLQGINLQYVLGLINFHDVEFAGLATGKLKVHNLFSDVAVDANLRVDDFKLNDGLLGTVFLTGGFGRKDERAIDLDAFVHEPTHSEISHVTALIKPGHEPGRGIDLSVNARRINTYFLNFFTESIFTDLQGQTSGYAHLYGPFKQLNLEGELALDTLSVGIDALGTRFHLQPGDSVHLHPGGIRFRNITIYDKYHGTDSRAHSGVINGEVRYQHFKNLSYDFKIHANELLGYDFHDFGDQTFYGTVYADGDVSLSGQPGQVNIDIKCRPRTGTVFTYNASSPDATTENSFINFRPDTSASVPLFVDIPVTDDLTLRSTPDASIAGTSEAPPPTPENTSDLHINFDLDITPEAQMRLLMDPRSEDYITLFGDGHIRANFFNKGRFQMYGTYRVDHGTYRLSLQDVIRKDFQFQPGSTITFGGSPMKGDLNLQAVYTVPSVSLNDLTVGSNFSASNVRVNCIMNIGGRAEQPQVSFDFDVPNVNEDEKQMVRSLISTEEERNLQVIYLLGIGRFYTYGLAADQSQTNAAVQSLLSSTLSGQLNNFLTNAIGNGNWNFGTNLSTGTQGWTDVDVEGSLSGRLLNNRLLINGTFGYRDTPIANTNFIGDFDVQWLLTPSGNLSLKAYSETNDRYFTKTALTTQGIGIQVKKDFNTLPELFRRFKH